MLTIPADIILEKNKLYSGEAVVELLEWQQAETGITVRLAKYNEDIRWNGSTWSKFWFEGGIESDTGGDSANTIQVKVSAVDKLVQGYLETLTNGGIGDTVIYRRVHSNHLDLGALLTATYEILDIDAGPNNEWVVFDLGIENFFLNQIPAHTTSRDVCRYSPSDTAICPYVNSDLCSRTFNDCIFLNQESVFGGQPGIPDGAFDLTSSREVRSTTSIDAKLFKVGQSYSLALDCLLGIGSASKIVSLDTKLNKTSTGTLSIDYFLVPGTMYKSLSIDALLNKPSNKTVPSGYPRLDAVLIGDLQVSTSLDAVLYGTKSVSIDSLLYYGNQVSASLDAQIEREVTKTFSIDSLIQRTIENTFALDAQIIKAQTGGLVIDSQLYSVGSFYQETQMDAILYGDYIEDTDGSPIQDTDGGYIEEPT